MTDKNDPIVDLLHKTEFKATTKKYSDDIFSKMSKNPEFQTRDGAIGYLIGQIAINRALLEDLAILTKKIAQRLKELP